MRRLLLFDFDGTVIDGSQGIWNCINYATDKMGLPRLPQPILDRFIGPSLYDSFIEYCENDPDRAQTFIAFYRERYAVTCVDETVLYPGIKELLADLQNGGFSLCVCSSKPLDYVKAIARRLGVYDRFSYYSCVSFGDDSSDKTDLARACLRHFGAGPAEAALIGDRIYDVRAAHAAGLAAVGVRWGFAPPGELEAAGADAIAETPEALGRLLTEGRV